MSKININRKGYKETKLGWIPVEWEDQTFRDNVVINQGLQIAISERYTEQIPNSYFYITNEFLRANSDKKYFILNPTQSVICNKDDILMTRTGNTGKVVTGVEGAFHNNFFKIKYDTQKLVKDFLYYYLVDDRTQLLILKLAGTSTIPDLNHSDFYKILIPIPPLPEQKKIAQILSTWDGAITKCERLIASLKVRKKGLMQQLLTGKTRLKGFDGEWKTVRLGDVGEVISGLTYSPLDINKDGVLVLRSSNIQKRRLSFKDTVFVNVQNGKFNPVKENDILICVRNGSKSLIGKNVLINKELEGVAFGAFMAIFRSENNYFLYHIFDSDIYKKEVYKNLGATINSINGSDLKKFRFPFPESDEQKAIAQILTTSDEEININEKYLASLQTQKKGLMQKLLTGEVRVNTDIKEIA